MRRRLLVGCCLLLVFLVVATTAGYGYVHYRFNQIRSVKVPGLHKSSSGRPFNLLVVGSDSRESLDDADGSRYGDVGGQRNDTTLVVRVEPARKRVSMLSIPRDLVVPIAGTGAENRINAAFTEGPGQLVKTIEQNFGVPIHHYLLIDFDGFRAIVDALGGIDVRFPYPSRDAKSGLDIREAGCRHLNGGRALALARSRYFSYQVDGVWRSDPWADLGRIRRQQAFLQALVKAALDKGLTNPVRTNAFVGSLVHEVTKDSALRVSDVIRTGAAFRSFSPSKLATYTLPVTVSTDHPLGDVLLLKQPDADTVVNNFLGRATPAQEAAPGTAGLAASTATQLRRSGYRIGTVGNAPTADLPRSQIAYAPGRLADAKTLATTVIGGARLIEDSTLTPPNLTLVLGPGFAGIRPLTAASGSATGGGSGSTNGTADGGSGSAGGSGAGVKKPSKPKKAVPDLRPYDPRPC
ncbi:MAG TPA: LCP family protein [Actinomycetota bacterium]|nr:LCP family protein [Actinomycetota bacterium]